jgi:hypothetical protein
MTQVLILAILWSDIASGSAKTNSGNKVHLYTNRLYRENSRYGKTVHTSMGYGINYYSDSRSNIHIQQNGI